MYDWIKLIDFYFSFVVFVSCVSGLAAPLNTSNLLDNLPFAIEVELSIQGRFNGFEEKVREKHLRVVRDALEALAIYGQNHPESNILGWKKDKSAIARKKIFFFLTDRDTVVVREPLQSSLGAMLQNEVLPVPAFGRYRSVFVPVQNYSRLEYFVLALRLDNCLYFPQPQESRPDAFARIVSRLANTLFGQATPFLIENPQQAGFVGPLTLSAWAALTADAANEREWEFLNWLLSQPYLDSRHPGQRAFLEEQRDQARARITATSVVSGGDCASDVADAQ